MGLMVFCGLLCAFNTLDLKYLDFVIRVSFQQLYKQNRKLADAQIRRCYYQKNEPVKTQSWQVKQSSTLVCDMEWSRKSSAGEGVKPGTKIQDHFLTVIKKALSYVCVVYKVISMK